MIKRLYKGLTAEGYAKFIASSIPGFCGPLSTATIYAQPSLVGSPTSTTYLVSFEVDMDSFIHRPELGDSCLIDPSEHPHLYNSNWTSNSSLSDDPIPYHGQPVSSWRLEETINGDAEWHELWARTPRHWQPS
jgi:hypothetical protein